MTTRTENKARTGTKSSARVRRAIATLALATAVTAPLSALVASPASAAGCPTWMCGTSGNHNEEAARDAGADHA